MYAHIGLHVRDLDAAVRFYEAVLLPLGHRLAARDDASASFGPADDPALYLYLDPARRSAGSGTHIALRAHQQSGVRSFHERGLAAGGKENGAPGIRADYGPNYYAAFLLDPDGNNLEAVCNSA